MADLRFHPEAQAEYQFAMPPIIAMPPPEYYHDLVIGLVLLVALATWFVWLTRSRRDERYRRANLGWLSLLGGPLLGLALALLVEAMSDVNPLDRWQQLLVFTGIGLFAGIITAAFFALTACFVKTTPQLAKDPISDLL